MAEMRPERRVLIAKNIFSLIVLSPVLQSCWTCTLFGLPENTFDPDSVSLHTASIGSQYRAPPVDLSLVQDSRSFAAQEAPFAPRPAKRASFRADFRGAVLK